MTATTLDRFIAWVAPSWGLSRLRARRLFDAAKSTPQNRAPTGRHSGDGLMDQARDKPRTWARHLDENLDLVTGLLNTLSAQAAAVTVEPQARTRGGELAEDVNQALAEAWEAWTADAEVTGGYSWGELVHLLARSWLRDGEVLIHHLERSAAVDYPDLPYQVQALEADYLPFELSEGRTRHGVELSAIGRPVAYHLWAEHPGNTLRPVVTRDRLVTVPAAQLTHLRRVQRLHQVRGITALHPIIRRLDDLRDYEESERIAARMAASVCAVITRDPAFETATVNATTKEREFYLQAGTVFDDMLPGEGVDLLNPTRPNPAAADWRAMQLRAVAAGAESSYSTLSRHYENNYSAQRQELVEHTFQVRRRLQEPMIAHVIRPMYARVVRQAVLAARVPLAGVDPATLGAVECHCGAVPWIDMLKEVQAEAAAIQAGIKSRHQVIRERGGDPRRVDAERDRDPQAATPTPPEESDGAEDDPAQNRA